MLQSEDAELKRRVIELAVELEHEIVDHPIVINGGADEETVAARIGDDHWLVALDFG